MKILVALRDVKTGAFLPPFTATTLGEAERTYGDILRQETIIGKHANDFPLYEVGRFDEQTGQVSPLVQDDGSAALPRLLMDAGQQLQLLKEG